MSVGSTYGKFFLLKKLAAGGMGEIFLARQQGPAGFEKVVVIKPILSHLTENPEYLQAFLQEAKLQARMNHSAIVQIFDLGQAEEDGSFYLAMEYVHGKSLHELIGRLKARRETLPPALASTIIERAAEGLSYAHNLTDNAGSCLNIVHRDISPHNVLISYQGDVKLIDFGIAKSDVNTNKTEAGTIKGKFFYMSPEQSAARRIDKRSDIFSLGIVAYEAITGDNPFWRPNVINALEAIQKQDPPPLSFERPELAPFERIVGKALAKAADDRYADASDFKDALTAARVSLGPPGEKLGALLQRVFKDKVEQENRVLVDTDSASLPLGSRSGKTKLDTGSEKVKGDSGSGKVKGDPGSGSGKAKVDTGSGKAKVDTGSGKAKVDTGKKNVGSGPKPKPKSAQADGDEDAALQREPTPVVEVPPQTLIPNAATQLSAPAPKAEPEAQDSDSETGEPLLGDGDKTPPPMAPPAATRTPPPTKAPTSAAKPEPVAEAAPEQEHEAPTQSLRTVTEEEFIRKPSRR